jgi:hypothetical protein
VVPLNQARDLSEGWRERCRRNRQCDRTVIVSTCIQSSTQELHQGVHLKSSWLP